MEVVLKELAEISPDCKLGAGDGCQNQGLVDIIAVTHASKYEEEVVLGIFDGMQMAGCASLGRDPVTRKYWLRRFSIEGAREGSGYAEMAMRKLLKYIYMNYEARKVFTSFGDGDRSAEEFFSKMGFSKTGEVDGDQVIALKDYDNDQLGDDYMCKVGFARCNYCMSCKWAKEGRLNERVDRKTLWHRTP